MTLFVHHMGMGMSMGARPYAAIHHWHGCWVICGHPPWAWVLGHTRPSTMGMGAGPYAAILSRTVRHHHHHRHLGKPTLNQQEPPSPAPVMLQQQQHPGTTLTIMGSTPAAATPSWAAHLQLPYHHGQHTCSGSWSGSSSSTTTTTTVVDTLEPRCQTPRGSRH